MRSTGRAIALDASDGTASFLLRRLEAGQLLDQHVTVGTIAPLKGSDPGAKRAGHRVKLFAVGYADDVGGSVGEILGLAGLEHLVERRIEEQPGDAGLGLPVVLRRVLAADHDPGWRAGCVGDFPLARLDHAVLGLADFLDAYWNAQQLIAFVVDVVLGGSVIIFGSR